MNNWYKKAQISISVSININAGTMRRMPTTLGSSTMDLDEICYNLNEVRPPRLENTRQILNSIADSGIILNIDEQGNINTEVNPVSGFEEEQKGLTDYSGPK